MAASDGFFGTRNAQAVLKHGILTRYAHYFAGRAGRATGGRVAFIDGYAGKGRYDDGSPGSPLLLASQAERAKPMQRTVRLAFVEQNALYRASLTASLEEAGVTPDRIIHGSLEDALPDLLERYQNHAIFLFIDPFGLALSRSNLTAFLRTRSRAQPIDVLYHLSLSTVARMGAVGVSHHPQAGDCARQLDEALGPDAWRAPFESSDRSDGAATAAAAHAADIFANQIQQETGVRGTLVPVRQRPGQLPKYLLVLFSADPSGRSHWDFVDQSSKAHEEWLHYCDVEDFEANLKLQDEQGLMSLFEPITPQRSDVERLLRDEALEYFRSTLPNVLRSSGPIKPIEHIEAIYGEMLGIARSTHLRKALQDLHGAGKLNDDCRGDYFARPLSWIGT